MTTVLDPSKNTVNSLFSIAEQFKPHCNIVEIEPFGSGNINDTYRVKVEDENQPYFILQRINTKIFQQPAAVMHNIRVFADHVSGRLQQCPEPRRWEVAQVLTTQQGQSYWQDKTGECWRAISFIENSQSFDTVQNAHHAWETGYALGTFHRLISDLQPEQIFDTLEGFHITPQYLQHYDHVLTEWQPISAPDIEYCLQFVRDRRALANVLEHAKAQGILQVRLMHGDPKINNILIDSTTGNAVSIIDLDTVKPGLIHYDIGDCLRSCCNVLGEETQQWQDVEFDTQLCAEILEGYLSQAKSFLTTADYHYIYDAIRVISFELGLRFFTDYLAGDVYFKTCCPTHNLARALVQFKLTESIEQQEPLIRSMIQQLR
jgi:Ser/Thr protein kinase RdoA (MazF antagonist)